MESDSGGSGEGLCITEAALSQLKNRIDPLKPILRIGVTQVEDKKSRDKKKYYYQLDWAAPRDLASDAAVKQCDGIQYVLESHLLNGVEIDYKDNLVDGGFKFSNPNVRSCGCGSSFHA